MMSACTERLFSRGSHRVYVHSLRVYGCLTPKLNPRGERMNFVSKGGIASTYLYVYTVRRFDFLVNQFSHTHSRGCDAMRQRASTLTRDSDARADGRYRVLATGRSRVFSLSLTRARASRRRSRGGGRDGRGRTRTDGRTTFRINIFETALQS